MRRLFDVAALISAGIACVLLPVWALAASLPRARATLWWTQTPTEVRVELRAIGWDADGLFRDQRTATCPLTGPAAADPDARAMIAGLGPPDRPVTTVWQDGLQDVHFRMPAAGRPGASTSGQLDRYSFPSLLAAAALLPAAWVVVALARRIDRRRQTQEGRCPGCGYDLRASQGRCPECGAAAGVIGPGSSGPFPSE